MKQYVRYATAVVFALLALGFVAFWVRSYYWWDLIIVDSFRLSSARGVTTFGAYDDGGGLPPTLLVSQSGIASEMRFWRIGILGFDYEQDNSASTLTIPHWFLAASSFALAALFAIKRTWRYSLRTVLVATTLLAGMLGLAAYAV